MALQTFPTFTPSGYATFATVLAPVGVAGMYIGQPTAIALPTGSAPDKVLVSNIGVEAAFVSIAAAAATDTGTAAAGAFNVALASGVGVLTGQVVVGTGVPPGTTVQDLILGAESIGSVHAGGSGYATATGLATTGGSGTGLTVNITASGAISAAVVNNPGSGYLPGDIVTVVQGGGSGGQLSLAFASVTITLSQALTQAISSGALAFATPVTAQTGVAVLNNSSISLAYVSSGYLCAICHNPGNKSVLNVAVGV